MLKMRSFTFRDQQVIWLGAHQEDIAALRRLMQAASKDPGNRVRLADAMTLDNPESLELVLVSNDSQLCAQGEFLWHCLDEGAAEDVCARLERLEQGRSRDESFALRPSPAMLLVEILRLDEAP
jgi:hypothetical protein